MKTAIIYYSKHHGNTKKLIEAIAKNNEIDLFDITLNSQINLSNYDRIGFASGIYYSKFQKKLIEYAKEKFPEGKETFFIYTYSVLKKGYTKDITAAVKAHNAKIIGEYGCYGFNTFGPFKIIGGLAKNHPDEADITKAVEFYEKL